MNKPSDKKPESEETFLLWTFLDIRDALVDIDKSLQGLFKILSSRNPKDTNSNTSTNSNTNSNTNTDNNTR